MIYVCAKFEAKIWSRDPKRRPFCTLNIKYV